MPRNLKDIFKRYIVKYFSPWLPLLSPCCYNSKNNINISDWQRIVKWWLLSIWKKELDLYKICRYLTDWVLIQDYKSSRISTQGLTYTLLSQPLLQKTHGLVCKAILKSQKHVHKMKEQIPSEEKCNIMLLLPKWLSWFFE